MELTKSELEIMDVLWETDAPMSRADLLNGSENKSWKDSSVHILLNGLLSKGVIQEAGFVKRSKTYGRTFLPTLSREAFYARMIFSRRHRPNLAGLVLELLHQPELTEEELQKVREIVRDSI